MFIYPSAASSHRRRQRAARRLDPAAGHRDSRSMVRRSRKWASRILEHISPDLVRVVRITSHRARSDAAPPVWPPECRPVRRRARIRVQVTAPPSVIEIDSGRQLFVDDYLIEATTLTRVCRTAVVRPRPVVAPDQPWEGGDNPTATVFSDGVVWDPRDRAFKMWYMAGYAGATCYATSPDGVSWAKPHLDVVPGTNIVNAVPRDSSTVWLDRADLGTGPFQDGRVRSRQRHDAPAAVRVTRRHPFDGAETPQTGDRTTFFFNPFRQRWVFSIRAGGEIGGRPRHRRYVEAASFEAARWTQGMQHMDFERCAGSPSRRLQDGASALQPRLRRV